MAPTSQQIQSVTAWRGHDLIDQDGSKIGRIVDIYLDEQTGQPEWLAVSTGMFGSKVSFVPLAGAAARSGELVCQWTKEEVKDAPRAEADGHLSQEEEARLYEYYGVSYSEARSDSGRAAGTTGEQPRRTARGHDTSGPNTDSAMTRSEEELRVGTAQQEAGRVRLRKWVDTEHVSETVPVRREQVRVEREPITEANRGAAMRGPEISEEVHEVTVYEERPVAEKVTVPKERIRLEKDAVTEQERVSADLQQERIEVEGDDNVVDRDQR
jgi:uncharacterized protein (TIGR02271 family)